MGIVLSKLLGSKTSLRERLEKVDKELRNIERFQYATEISEKRWIGRLMIASAVLWFVSAVVYYFLHPRHTPWLRTVLYIAPFAVFPFIIWGLKWFMSWYYKRKTSDNVERSKELRMERQRLLEDVMEYETFNNAKEILEKYDPKRLLPKYLAEQRLNSPLSISASPQESLRQRNLTNTFRSLSQTPTRLNLGGRQGQFIRQPTNTLSLQQQHNIPAILPPPSRITSQLQSAPGHQTINPQPFHGPGPMYMTPQPPGNPTLHNRSTGWLDKLVDYVVGDGAVNRYALICRYCATHNGLATPEDFPFTGYRCVFCRQYNPPRQTKPQAERLPLNTVLIEEIEQERSENPSPKSSNDISSHEKTEDKEEEDSKEEEESSQSIDKGRRASETSVEGDHVPCSDPLSPDVDVEGEIMSNGTEEEERIHEDPGSGEMETLHEDESGCEGVEQSHLAEKESFEILDPLQQKDSENT